MAPLRQAFLREMLAALDAMPERRLIEGDLQSEEGVCAIGAVGLRRGVDMSKIDPEYPTEIARAFGISVTLVREIESENDLDSLWSNDEPPEARWERMRAWVVSQIWR